MKPFNARRSHRVRNAVIVATLALTAAACGSDDDGDVLSGGGGATSATSSTTTEVEESTDTVDASTTTTIGGGAATTDPTTTTSTTTTTTTTSTTTTTTTTTTVPPAPGECLIGTWSLRSQEFLDEIAAAIPPEMTGGAAVDWKYVSGEYLITMNADGTTRGQRLAWTHRLSTPQGALVTTIDSDDPGTYTVDGNAITVLDSASEATVRLQIEIGGVLQDLPIGGTQTVGTDAISGSGTFECAGDVLSITVTDLPDAPPGGITVTLDRAAG
jgi:hypothetical protein